MGKYMSKKYTIYKRQRDLWKTNPSQPKPQSLLRRVLGILTYLKIIWKQFVDFMVLYGKDNNYIIFEPSLDTNHDYRAQVNQHPPLHQQQWMVH